MVINAAEAKERTAKVRQQKLESVASDIEKSIDRAISDNGRYECMIVFPTALRDEVLKMLSEHDYNAIGTSNAMHNGKSQLKIRWN